MRSAQRPYEVILCGLCRNGGKAPLNDWLRRPALRNEGRASRTFVVCQGDVVAGYYALAVGSVESRDAPRAVRKNMPPQVPVLILGHLAVDLGHHGRGMGAGLLGDALRRALGVAAEVGVRAILVHAIDAEVVPFYSQYGFKPFPEGSLTFFPRWRKWGGVGVKAAPVRGCTNRCTKNPTDRRHWRSRLTIVS